MCEVLNEYQVQVVLLKLNAFLEDDGYAHFSLNNLKIKGIGETTMAEIMKYLEDIGEIKDCTVNGFYKRYKITHPTDCPDYIGDDSSISIKTFIYKCSLLDNPTERKSARVIASLYGKAGYKHESYMLTQVKQTMGMSVFEVLKNSKPIKLKVSNDKYALMKTKNGYQVDSYHEERIRNEKESYVERKERMIKSWSLGKYILRKIKNRSSNQPERFLDNTITEEEIEEIYKKQNGLDFYTGLPLNDKVQISADRIDCSKPYTKDNVVLTTVIINITRGDLSIKDFLALCKKITDYNNQFPRLDGEGRVKI